MYFEGPEKKLEVVMLPEAQSLRQLGDGFWHDMVRKAGAQVLSVLRNDFCDAYLLSESSLFVYNDSFTMITCGRTTLVDAARLFLQKLSNRNLVASLIYERKNEIFPHNQCSSFYQDITKLNEFLSGKAFRLGSEDGHHILLYHLDRGYTPDDDDTTLEILMHGLSPEAQKTFAGPKANRDAIRAAGLYNICAGYQVDDYLFEPMGYSLNALNERQYYTVHVTPQEMGSYVSFETNHKFDDQDLAQTIEKVLKIFAPESCDILLFQGKKSLSIPDIDYLKTKAVRGHLNCGYHLDFSTYVRPSNGIETPFEITGF